MVNCIWCRIIAVNVYFLCYALWFFPQHDYWWKKLWIFYVQGKRKWNEDFTKKKPQRYQGMFTFFSCAVICRSSSVFLVSASQLRDFVTRCVTLIWRVRVNIQVAYSSVKNNPYCTVMQERSFVLISYYNNGTYIASSDDLCWIFRLSDAEYAAATFNLGSKRGTIPSR